MLLWDIIRNFFVQYIFGGSYLFVDSDGNESVNYVSGFLGCFFNTTDEYMLNGYTDTTFLSLNGFEAGDLSSFDCICLGDYLSTTATIIVLTLICVAIGMAVIWLFKEVYRMITKWAF